MCRNPVCVSGRVKWFRSSNGILDCLSLALQLCDPFCPLWAVLDGVQRCSPAWGRPQPTGLEKCIYKGEPRGLQSPNWNWATQHDFWIMGKMVRALHSPFRHWWILVSWNCNFGYLDGCRKADAKETKGSHYSPPNLQLFWHRTGNLVILNLCLQFVCRPSA